jgi:hypothetical protein
MGKFKVIIHPPCRLKKCAKNEGKITQQYVSYVLHALSNSYLDY